MRNLWKSLLGLWVIGTWLGVSVPAQAASAAGPYYAKPSWDQTLPAATRFVVLTNMGSEAVLDRETGLVWEQSPTTTAFTWENASEHCAVLTAGGRAGWRLPTIQDLASLLDSTVAEPGPTLPAGHPFNVQSYEYWAASTSAVDARDAWLVDFEVGSIHFGVKSALSIPAWCVRGGQGVDPQ